METRGLITVIATICVTEQRNAALMTHGKTTSTVLVILLFIAAPTILIRKMINARATQTSIAVLAIHSPQTATAHVIKVYTAVSPMAILIGQTPRIALATQLQIAAKARPGEPTPYAPIATHRKNAVQAKMMEVRSVCHALVARPGRKIRIALPATPLRSAVPKINILITSFVKRFVNLR